MKHLLPLFFVVVSLFSGSAAFGARPLADSKCPERQDIRDVSLRKTMELYAVRYDNLRPIEGRCPSDHKLVQLALLLDTSNSMDGLINQAKSQLWRIVNELSRMHKRGESVRLQVALYEYGNNALSPASGYIRQVTPFTEDLDLLSEALFSLDTYGGSEYCGHVIGSSLNRLRWNSSPQGLKLIYIAGNEPFDQGEVSYESACRWAAERDIIVNTIYCGDYRTGVNTFWKRGATIGGGSYFAINSDMETKGTVTPYGHDLMELNKRINATYVPYGREGKRSFARQAEQDRKAEAFSAPVAAERAASKVSSLYEASRWDLVDAIETKAVTVQGLDREHLPDELKGMSGKEIEQFVHKKRQERYELKRQIAELGRKRDGYLRNREQSESGSQSLGSVIIKNLRAQAEVKNFSLR